MGGVRHQRRVERLVVRLADRPLRRQHTPDEVRRNSEVIRSYLGTDQAPGPAGVLGAGVIDPAAIEPSEIRADVIKDGSDGP